jgi:hypothetical protein
MAVDNLQIVQVKIGLGLIDELYLISGSIAMPIGGNSDY